MVGRKNWEKAEKRGKIGREKAEKIQNFIVENNSNIKNFKNPSCYMKNNILKHLSILKKISFL